MSLPLPELQILTERDCEFYAAGRLWVIPEIHYARLPDGSTGLNADELARIHTAIANEICGEPDALTSEELEFLCDVTDATLTELADLLRMDKSTLSRWRSGTRGIPHSASWIVKRWIWYHLFGSELTSRKVALHHFETDVGFLPYARRQAIENGLTFAVVPHFPSTPMVALG